MRVLLTGAGGQLGRALLRAVPAEVTLHGAAHGELDVADAAAVAAAVRDFAPQLIINAAAFTGVDAAETRAAEAARANALGPQVLAAACRASGAWLTHLSTDYVFDGRQGQPYATDAPAHPLNVYGRSKLEGERAVSGALPERSTVVRTSWLYSADGGFAQRMLSLLAARPELRVVSDQTGVPTHAAGLATVLWELSLRRTPGLWHWCDSGIASWYDFAVAIAEEGLRLGLLGALPVIRAVGSTEYPTAAARAPYTVLDKRATEGLLGRPAPHWRVALRDTLAERAAGAVAAGHATGAGAGGAVRP